MTFLDNCPFILLYLVPRCSDQEPTSVFFSFLYLSTSVHQKITSLISRHTGCS